VWRDVQAAATALKRCLPRQVRVLGIDGVYPKGIPVGTVLSAEEGRDLFKRVVVAPAIDFASLEEVIVLHTRKIPTDVVRYQP